MRTDALRFSLWVALAVSIASPACNCLNPITDVKYPACGSDADCELREGYHCCELASAGTGKHCVPGTCDAPPDGGAGGAADAGVCNATSCANGCCLPDAGCASGRADEACGVNGVTCQTCPSGQCNGTTCTGCSAANCPSGCCWNGACQGGTAQLCGKDGLTCASCGSDSDRCAQGSCVCGTTGGPCPSGTRCEGGRCICSASTCRDGCCTAFDGGTCQAPPSAAACGMGGALCSACDPALADSCDSTGTCRCGDHPACVAGTHCSGGECKCDGTSCSNGCCAADGGCETGTVNGACGKNGAACDVCAGASTCTNQACSGCDTSCAGCCMGGVCQTSGNSTCGSGGATCRACKALETCSGNACLCQGSVCTAGQECTATGCACTAASCPGGCCDGNVCRSGVTAMACGGAGAACQTCAEKTDTCRLPGRNCGCGSGPACGAGELCFMGSCVCAQLSCPSGCCFNNRCYGAGGSAPIDLNHCGGQGASCSACSPVTANGCSTAGACTCNGAAECGAGQRCQTGVGCVCDQASCSAQGGCCSGGRCVTPSSQTVNTCGAMGAACVDCASMSPPRADNCANGNCRCGVGAACGPGQWCKGGSCVCDNTSCTGCCQGNSCQSGTANGACGTGGVQCQSCPCSGGACTGCGPGNCGTCCANNVCAGATGPSQCGMGGTVCVECGKTADTCAGGACRCGGGPACNPGERCSLGSCVCEPANCTGCCSNASGTGRCVTPQPNSAACGLNGNVCRSCMVGVAGTVNQCGAPDGGCGCGTGPECIAGQRCGNRAGTPSCICDAISCPGGCCDNNNLCQSGKSDTACGASGLQCENCTEAGLPCVAQSCGGTGGSGGGGGSGGSGGGTGGAGAGSGGSGSGTGGAGSGTGGAGCNPTTCNNGCCDTSGACVVPPDDAHCLSAQQPFGTACRVCSGGTHCTSRPVNCMSSAPCCL